MLPYLPLKRREAPIEPAEDLFHLTAVDSSVDKINCYERAAAFELATKIVCVWWVPMAPWEEFASFS